MPKAIAALFALLFGLALPLEGLTQSAEKDRVEKGWFFFDDPVVPEPAPEPPAPPLPRPAPQPPRSPEDPCSKPATWTAECGFVHPGSDFEFQAKQRDALMQRMSVAPNDPKAVEAFQYYMRWVLERTSEVTNLWWYNMVQNPDLDPNVRAPVSAFGLRLMTDVQRGRDQEIFDLIKAEGGFFVYFSRHDCVFCHNMSTPLQALSRETGLPIRNAALDERCMPGFEEGCMKAPATFAPAQALQVTTVPAIFLYVPENTWLRVATGVVDTQSMVNRTSQFFQAYRNALLGGTRNSVNGRPSVDFGGNAVSGTAPGLRPSAEGTVRPPSESEIVQMLRAAP